MGDYTRPRRRFEARLVIGCQHEMARRRITAKTPSKVDINPISTSISALLQQSSRRRASPREYSGTYYSRCNFPSEKQVVRTQRVQLNPFQEIQTQPLPTALKTTDQDRIRFPSHNTICPKPIPVPGIPPFADHHLNPAPDLEHRNPSPSISTNSPKISHFPRHRGRPKLRSERN